MNLTRELSNIKPELDHLRSQNLAFQSLLSEKLSLQRQLSTLQIEIENERRSKERLTSGDSKVATEDRQLEACLEEAQAELARERREKTTADREAKKSLAVLQNKITMYESRLDAFRGKLKSTKESLKEVQSELQKFQISVTQPTATTTKPMSRARNTQKRAASEMDANTIFGTPGDLAPAKIKKVKPTMVGERDTFSTTPFLSRMASLGPESPPFTKTGDNCKHIQEIASPPPDETLKTQMLTQPAVSTRTEKTIAEVKSDPTTTVPNLVSEKGKKTFTRKPPKKDLASPRLPQVAEEVEVNFRTVSDDAASRSRRKEDPVMQVNEALEKKKMKRKILGGSLGKTLFDEDDGDALKGGRRIGAARSFMKRGKGGLGEADANLVADANFGPFSPLKKDRKPRAG